MWKTNEETMLKEAYSRSSQHCGGSVWAMWQTNEETQLGAAYSKSSQLTREKVKSLM